MALQSSSRRKSQIGYPFCTMNNASVVLVLFGPFQYYTGKGIGLPSCEDWEYVEATLPFLSIFYEATLGISGTSYVTSNMYMLEVAIDKLFDVDKANGSKSRLKSSLKSLFNDYNGHKGGAQDDTQ
ncbi:hypothetical protein JHK87_012067 [Glycine soja]|nr:hypothetical protein JHK87_012067 [Glycine soja]